MRPTRDIKILNKVTTTDADGNEVETFEETIHHWDLAVWAWFGLAPSPDPEDENEAHEAYYLRL